MNQMRAAVTTYWSDVWEAWNRFWFTPTDPATLSAIRLFAGAMMFYTHLVWSRDLTAFFGSQGWLPLDFYAIERRYDLADQVPSLMWSLFQHIGDSPTLIWTVHIIALVSFFCLMIGFFSRTAAVLSAFFAIMYVARVTPGAFFGLDKVNCMLALYLMLGPCGARYSVDRLRRLCKGETGKGETGKGGAGDPPSSAANVAIRLMQLHMCVIYFYSALGKLEGETWWTGEAIWLAVSSREYQSWDMTWLGHYPAILHLIAHATVFWELCYSFLVWPRFTRPWMLAIAVGMHGFIACCMGMITFGLAMLIGNLAFVSPATVQQVLDPVARRISLALVGERNF